MGTAWTAFENNIQLPRGYKTLVQSQTQNKVQCLADCGHVSASSQSLRFILYFESENEFKFYYLEASW